ncbi:hypothetical protein V6N13_104301 [Hibiscus sabdariffa]|uniref:DUF4283 domain-containing protein n=1 Tax=Hibiscus sabdariffa TaxID=183260 RepID=A0ABR2DI80_9ROSI
MSSHPLQLINIENDFFLVEFSDRGDYQKVLTEGPWSIFDHYITVEPCSIDFNPLQASPSQVMDFRVYPTRNPVFNSNDPMSEPISEYSLQDSRSLVTTPIHPPISPPAFSVVQHVTHPSVPPGPLQAAAKANGKFVVASKIGSNLMGSKKSYILVSKISKSHHANSIVSMQGVLRIEATCSKGTCPTSNYKTISTSSLDRSKHQIVQIAGDSHRLIPIIAIIGANSKVGHEAMAE